MQIDFAHFTPVSAFVGGILIGLAAAMLILFNGRIAGISGILGGALRFSETRQNQWRLFFLIGLIVSPWAYGLFLALPTVKIHTGTWGIILAGLLVGYGSRLGSGCTSGHGVCGTARLSRRSMAATLTFISSGMITVYLLRHL
jgi:uncharacterized membrane protein YedE/YeeE